MKKIFSVVLAVVLIFGCMLTCYAAKKPTNPTKTTKEVVVETAKSKVPLNSVVTVEKKGVKLILGEKFKDAVFMLETEKGVLGSELKADDKGNVFIPSRLGGDTKLELTLIKAPSLTEVADTTSKETETTNVVSTETVTEKAEEKDTKNALEPIIIFIVFLVFLIVIVLVDRFSKKKKAKKYQPVEVDDDSDEEL